MEELLGVMLLIAVILMIVLLFLILVVQVILVILVVLVLVVLVIGVCKLRSEDIRIDEDNRNSEDTSDGCDFCFGSGRDEDSTTSSFDADDSENSDAGSTEENKAKNNCLSAGGAMVIEDFPFMKHRRLWNGAWVSYPSPNEAAIFKHIDPTCKTTEDAEKKSLERNSRYPQETGEYNTVFQVSPDDFTLEPHTTHGRVLKSKEAVRNWKCKKISKSKYEGTEESRMHAVFLAEADCHYSPGESRKTRASRASGGSVLLLDLISQDKSRKRSISRGRSRIKNSRSEPLRMDFKKLNLAT